jgi:peptidoglycan/LPS O-acetylase OafA/YrhL
MPLTGLAERGAGDARLHRPAADRPHIGFSYHRGLDGLRALAVIAVLLYHGGVSWAGGGFLGVEAFFVLSGFLITSLLVVEWRRSARIALGAFWGRRARRLLPALFAMVLVVGLHQALVGPAGAVPGLKPDGIAALFYFGNWHQIATQNNYFVATGPVSPLQHTWSLGIEEQFYVFWPVILLAVIWCSRRMVREGRSERRTLLIVLAVSIVGALGSALEAALLFHSGSDPNRIYYGTDTRAMSLLTGASLAIAMAVFPVSTPRKQEQRPQPGRRLLGWLAALALVGVLAMMGFAAGESSWLYPGGLLGLDLAVALVITALVLAPASPVGRLFSLGPVRAVGQISYGIYIWHFPLFLWLDSDFTGRSGFSLLVLRLVVTLIVSLLSYFLLEQPVRRRRLPDGLVRTLAPVALGAALVALLVGSAAASPSYSSGLAPAKQTARYAGASGPCSVTLKDPGAYGVSPVPPQVAAVQQPQMEAAHRLTWTRSSRVTFHTCPPKRVLLIGDSLAFSTGLAVMWGEQRYGVEMANAALLGCAFTNRGQLNITGTWSAQAAGCPGALGTWANEERTFHPRVVVFELGYRDEFDWRWNGRVVHLGQPAFDNYLQQRIEHYVTVLGRGGTKILFLSIPWTHPNPLPNGSPAPAGSAARHALINAMLSATARRHPGQVQVLDLDQYISPGNHYNATLDGKLCRFDGVHFTIFCGEKLQQPVLSTASSMARR